MIDEWLYEYHSWRVSALLFPWNGVLKKIWGSWKKFQRFGGDPVATISYNFFGNIFVMLCCIRDHHINNYLRKNLGNFAMVETWKGVQGIL